MKFKLLKESKRHISDFISRIDAIYIYDDLEEVYYQNELNESAGNNTLPADTIISKSDVENLLTKIKSCQNVFVVPRPKTNGFLAQLRLTPTDCKNIIDQLTIEDYVKNTTSVNSKHPGDNLVIFEPSTLIVQGNKMIGLIIYIKIDIDESTDTTIVSVSFHNTNMQDNMAYK